MSNRDDNSKKLNFDDHFFNVIFSTIIEYAGSTFCLNVVQIHFEGTVSQIFYLGLVFILCQKSGNIVKKIEITFFKLQEIKTRAKLKKSETRFPPL